MGSYVDCSGSGNRLAGLRAERYQLLLVMNQNSVPELESRGFSPEEIEAKLNHPTQKAHEAELAQIEQAIKLEQAVIDHTVEQAGSALLESWGCAGI